MTTPDKNGDLIVAICPDCNMHSVCDPAWARHGNELIVLQCENCTDHSDDIAREHLLAKFAPAVGWQPIETAPKDRVILVNDTTGAAPWAAARWCSFESYSAHVDAWEGWVYDDELLADSNSDGPCPTHWLDIPTPP